MSSEEPRRDEQMAPAFYNPSVRPCRCSSRARRTARRLDSNLAQNERGEWVPAIPLPFIVRLRSHCHCGKKFPSTRRYREHYALVHILGLS